MAAATTESPTTSTTDKGFNLIENIENIIDKAVGTTPEKLPHQESRIKPRARIHPSQMVSGMDTFHRDAFANRFSDDYGKLPDADGIIRYGNKIALKHVRSGRYLHSENASHMEAAPLPELKDKKHYRVVSQNWTPQHEHDYWLVLPYLGQSQLLGKPVPYGKDIRLQHFETKCQLRTVGEKYENVTLPDKRENIPVTAFPESMSNVNDVWTVQYFIFTEDWATARTHRINEREDDKVWKVDDMISLRHRVTRMVLKSEVELKGESKKPLAPVDCGVSGDMGAIWRVVVPHSKQTFQSPIH